MCDSKKVRKRLIRSERKKTFFGFLLCHKISRNDLVKRNSAIYTIAAYRHCVWRYLMNEYTHARRMHAKRTMERTVPLFSHRNGDLSVSFPCPSRLDAVRGLDRRHTANSALISREQRYHGVVFDRFASLSSRVDDQEHLRVTSIVREIKYRLHVHRAMASIYRCMKRGKEKKKKNLNVYVSFCNNFHLSVFSFAFVTNFWNCKETLWRLVWFDDPRYIHKLYLCIVIIIYE